MRSSYRQRDGGDTAEWILRPAHRGSRSVERRRAPRLPWVLIGIEHIVGGLDHVAFVIGLLLVLRRRRSRLLLTITASRSLTSLTLALAVIDVIAVPSAPVERASPPRLAVAREAPTAGRPPSGAGPGSLPVRLVSSTGSASHPRSARSPSARVPRVELVWFNVGVALGQLAVCSASSRWRGSDADQSQALEHRAARAPGVCYVLGRLRRGGSLRAVSSSRAAAADARSGSAAAAW